MKARLFELKTTLAVGHRLTDEEALFLFQDAELPDLALLATTTRNHHNKPDEVTFVIDRNINFTDVCNIHCSFCAFHRPPGDPGAFVLSMDELRRKCEETKALGGTGILVQGGVNPDLPWSYYLEMVSLIRHEMGLWVHGFSPVEIQAMAKLNGLGLRGTLEALREAGLGSLPGGGAEILVDAIRQRIAPLKGGVQAWLEVMEEAHRIGMKTTGTMMFGINESRQDRIQHLHFLREQQDRAVARNNGGGYTAFAAWPFQSGNTTWEGKIQPATHVDYLKTIAISRIYLDNFKHIQSSWVTMGGRTGQLALHYGCDDMGSLMLEENVVNAAGTHFEFNAEEMDAMIRGAGFQPRQRDNTYGLLG